MTHIYGAAADMDPIMEIAERHELFVVEDCAQALLSYYKGRLCGTIGHVGCFSFQQSKHITTGDGGMVLSNDDMRYGRALSMCVSQAALRLRASRPRSQKQAAAAQHDKGWPRDGINKPVEEGETVVFGSRDHLFLAPNYHMTELQAAVGLAQLAKLPAMVAARQASAAALDAALGDADEIQRLGEYEGCEGSVFWYVFTVDSSRLAVGTEQIHAALVAEGIKCEHGYPGPRPLYVYDVLRKRKTFGSRGFPLCSPPARKEWHYPDGLCPVAEHECPNTICLHWSECYSSEHVALIAAAINKVLDAYRFEYHGETPERIDS